jgi:hypothetical protein
MEMHDYLPVLLDILAFIHGSTACRVTDTAIHILTFVAFQRRQPDLLLAGVGMVNCAAIMAQLNN